MGKTERESRRGGENKELGEARCFRSKMVRAKNSISECVVKGLAKAAVVYSRVGEKLRGRWVCMCVCAECFLRRSSTLQMQKLKLIYFSNDFPQRLSRFRCSLSAQQSRLCKSPAGCWVWGIMERPEERLCTKHFLNLPHSSSNQRGCEDWTRQNKLRKVKNQIGIEYLFQE